MNNEQALLLALGKLSEIMKIIKNCHSLVFSLKDPNLQRTYAAQCLDIIQEFEDCIKDTKPLFISVFKEEEEKNLPTNLSYRKLYKYFYSTNL